MVYTNENKDKMETKSVAYTDLFGVAIETIKNLNTRLVEVEEKLKRDQIAYQIYPLTNGRINVFFGADECVDVVKAIDKARLSEWTPQEDFILGIMLGYDRLKQCRRYLQYASADYATAGSRLALLAI